MYKTPLAEFYGEMMAELGKVMAGQLVKTGRILPYVPTRDEVWALYDHAKTTRDLLILRTFYASGIRNAELVHLKVADLRVTTCELFIREGKFGEDRYVRVDRETMEMLLQWRKTQRLKPADAVFGLKTTRQIHRIVVGCGARSGITKTFRGMGRRFSPHSLRHCMATHSYENGMDLFTLKKLLGHRFLETTQIYVHLAMKKESEVYDRTHEMCRRAAPQHVRPQGIPHHVELDRL
ncbi:MAG: tyrosine-type recombinase/integrase [Gammaproteobacteria bacterium]|nr:tyrosine-type recombinase/integrase [Gammaproteobacteria bacterium]